MEPSYKQLHGERPGTSSSPNQSTPSLHLRRGWRRGGGGGGWGDIARQRSSLHRAHRASNSDGPTPHTESLLREKAVASAYLHD
jgi:hypothetical protein